jgi:hypothetical protein
MTSKLFQAIDKMPLAGKYSIRDSIKWYIKSTPESENRRFAATSAYMGAMAVAHAYQAFMGTEAITQHMEHFQNSADPSNIGLLGIDAAYLMVNTAVAARQANLGMRVGQIHGKRRKNRDSSPVSPTLERKSSDLQHVTAIDEATEEYSPVECGDDEREAKKAMRKSRRILGATAITLAGQMIFVGAYTDARVKESVNACYTSFGEYYDEYVDLNPDAQLEQKEAFLSRTCE